MKNLITDKDEIVSRLKKTTYIICDVDGTVTEDLKPLHNDMVKFMTKLSHKHKYFIFISGTDIKELSRMISSKLSFDHVICGSSGAHIVLIEDGESIEVENITIPLQHRQLIKSELRKIIQEFNLPEVNDQILDRGSQITLSCIGRYADSDHKNNFDPDGTKRLSMVRLLEKRLPGFSIKIGGTTSIDIIKNKFDKASGIKLLMTNFDVNYDNSIFIGDRLHESGNDFPVLKELDCISVKDSLDLLNMFILATL